MYHSNSQILILISLGNVSEARLFIMKSDQKISFGSGGYIFMPYREVLHVPLGFYALLFEWSTIFLTSSN